MAKDSNTSEITELKKKLEENPDSLAFAPLGDAYRKQGNLVEALNICKKGLEKHPNNTSGRVVLGRVYHQQGKIAEAASEFKKVLELDPENLMSHSFLGSIYLEKGDHQSAIEEYQKILTLNPDDEETQAALKQAIEKAAGEQKTNKTAKKDPPPGKKTPPQESTATLTIAELYLKQGHFDKAIEVFQELLANDPQNLMLRQKLSEVVDRQQKAFADGTSKNKKNEFTNPPDQKEETLEDVHADSKRPGKPKKEDDSKFTSDDILQVMRRGGKDDVVVEEGKSKEPLRKLELTPEIKATPAVKKETPSLSSENLESLKGILAELGAVEGIMKSFIVGGDGALLVSLGEIGSAVDYGQQAAAIFEGTKRSVAQMKQGKLQQVLVTAQTGHILLVSFATYVLVVLANSRINLGLLRLALDSASKKLDRIL